MILLDTDHLSILKYRSSSRCVRLHERLGEVLREPVATTVVNLEEQMRGWITEISRYLDFHDQIFAYERLAELFDFFARWQKVPFDSRAADECRRLRDERVRIGTMDLKIAAIAIVNDALLLSANLRDFQKVPGLRVENWLD